jgi:hypothetical protein
MGACVRCGLEYLSEIATERALEEGRKIVCADCRRSKVKVIKYWIDGVATFCRPWHGDFDDDDYPVDDKGKRFTGEVALCGHKDCIAFEHRPGMQVPKKNKVRVREMVSMESFIAVAEARGQL